MTIEADPVDINAIDKVLELMGCASAAPAVPLYRGGADAAEKHLREFITGCLDGYSEHRNQPQTDFVSHMSKYLHFGQISPVSLALQVRDSQQGKQEDRDAFLEELLVRRELCLNYVHRTPNYDSYSALPEWALNALADHSGDPRPHLYAAQELENAQTDDPYWNAAMREMKFTGYMHNYMRMYWGKKILEWSKTPEEAFRLTLDLNNKYFIDGRDPISFASVAWIFGLHDRPWQTRPVFGSVRCMTAGGLERKTDPDAYVRKVNALVEKLEA